MKKIFKTILKTLGFQSLIRFYHFVKISVSNIKNIRILKQYVINHGGNLKNEDNFILFSIKSKNTRDVNYALRKRSSDVMVFQQLIIEEEYQGVIDLLNKHKIKVNSIIDAGANIGLSTVFFKNLYPSSTVVCIEPDDDNCLVINKHVNMNEFSNVFIEKVGLWDLNSYLTIVKDFRDGAKWSLRVKAVDYETKLRGVSVNYLLNKYNLKEIDLLKIDIEGSEKILLENEDNLKEYISLVKVACIEVHEEFIATSKVISILEKHNFVCFRILDLTIGIRKDLIQN